MKRNLFLIVISILSFYGSCLKGEKKYTIYINNNSIHQIRFYFDALTRFHYYPDTVLPLQMPQMATIEPEKRFYQDASIRWEQFIADLPADTLSLYIFHPDTLALYNWSEIRAGYKILKRYDLSIQYLQNNNFTITYP